MEILSAFHFLRPWWLLLLPLCIWLAVLLWRNRGHGTGWSDICDPALLQYLTGANDHGADMEAAAPVRHKRYALWLLTVGSTMAVIALAGPVWQQLPQPLFRAQSALVIGLDLSRSMLAQDAKPSRLIRARQKLQDILALRQEGQTALVVFAGTAFDVVPLTSDNRAILAMLDALEPAMMPEQGSRASTALKHAAAIFQRNAIHHGTVLLLTDGVDDAAVTIAAQLAEAGHRVSVIGVGSDAGAPIPVAAEQGGFVQDPQGNIVIARLQPQRLRQLADAGHGIYQQIHFDDADIRHIPGLKPARAGANGVDAVQADLVQTDLWREAGPWLLLLVLPLFSLLFRRGVLLVVLIVPLAWPDGAYAMSWSDWWQRPDQQASVAMQQGDPAAAAELFQNRDWKAVALYRAKQYQQAAATLDGVERADSWYNRGNALAKAGELKPALDAYEHALKLDPAMQDAAFNRDLVKKALQQSKQQSQQKQGGKQQDEQQHRDKQQQGKQQKDQQGQQDQSQSQGDQQNSAQSRGDQSGSNQQQAGQQGQDKQAQAGQQQGGQKQGEAQNSNAAGKPSDEQQSATQKSAVDKAEEQQAARRAARQAEEDAEGDASKQAKALRQAAGKSGKNSEASAALQQWLRRVPDDPGGLLRRKFLYQYQQQQSDRQRSQQQGVEAW